MLGQAEKECSESAQEQRIALYKSNQQQGGWGWGVGGQKKVPIMVFLVSALILPYLLSGGSTGNSYDQGGDTKHGTEGH